MMDNRTSVEEFWRLRLEPLDEWRGYAGGEVRLGLGGICRCQQLYGACRGLQSSREDFDLSRNARLRRGYLQAEGDSTMQDLCFVFVDAGDI